MLKNILWQAFDLHYFRKKVCIVAAFPFILEFFSQDPFLYKTCKWLFLKALKYFKCNGRIFSLKKLRKRPNVSLELFSQNGFPEVALSSLRQILPTKNALKMMKNNFYFTWKALLVLKIFQFLFWIFGYVIKRLDMKVNVNFKTYDVTN